MGQSDLSSYSGADEATSAPPEETKKVKKKSSSNKRATAEDLAAKQRDISIAEFFEKNRHLLGFDNKRKSLLTAVKEAVDNSLDACEESGIVPEIFVEIIDMKNDRFRIIVEDNGPGIIKPQIPKIFAKLLYGSKFHSRKQSRGQQGIGISASVMYGQLTTGRPARIVSKTKANQPAHYYELKIDTRANKPQILKDDIKEWPSKETGTRIEIDLEGSYIKGKQSVDEYLKETAITNPHLNLIYTNPKAEQIIFPRATEEMPKLPTEIKPHPYGIELGMLIRMLEVTPAKTLQQFLSSEFSRVTSKVAKEIAEGAKILPNTKPAKINRQMAEEIMGAIQKTKIMAPSTDCISPMGEEMIMKGLKKEYNAEFYCAVSRTPAVYRGNPFVIECGIAYGGALEQEGTVDVVRFANRVPLLYQQGACAITDSICKTGWRSYGLSQVGSNLPTGSAVIMVHMASVWVPFTSEAKEALAHYPEIIKEIKLAIQEAGRKLNKYTAKKRRVADELKKRGFIEKYIPHLALGLGEILKLDKADVEVVEGNLKTLLEQSRGKVEDVEFDPTKNTEYDEDFAAIGKEEKSDDDESANEESEGGANDDGSGDDL